MEKEYVKWMVNRLQMINMHLSDAREQVKNAEHRLDRAKETLMHIECASAQMQLVLFKATSGLRGGDGEHSPFFVELAGKANSKVDRDHPEFLRIMEELHSLTK